MPQTDISLITKQLQDLGSPRQNSTFFFSTKLIKSLLANMWHFSFQQVKNDNVAYILMPFYKFSHSKKIVIGNERVKYAYLHIQYVKYVIKRFYILLFI